MEDSSPNAADAFAYALAAAASFNPENASADAIDSDANAGTGGAHHRHHRTGTSSSLDPRFDEDLYQDDFFGDDGGGYASAPERGTFSNEVSHDVSVSDHGMGFVNNGSLGLGDNNLFGHLAAAAGDGRDQLTVMVSELLRSPQPYHHDGTWQKEQSKQPPAFPSPPPNLQLRPEETGSLYCLVSPMHPTCQEVTTATAADQPILKQRRPTHPPQSARLSSPAAKVRKCTVDGCPNRVVQGGRCISHGARRKMCYHPGCTKNVKKLGLCSTHGPARKRCEFEGCTRVAVKGGRCIAHGAKKKVCSIEECQKQAILKGMCKKHHDEINGIVKVRGGSPKKKKGLLREVTDG